MYVPPHFLFILTSPTNGTLIIESTSRLIKEVLIGRISLSQWFQTFVHCSIWIFLFPFWRLSLMLASTSLLFIMLNLLIVLGVFIQLSWFIIHVFFGDPSLSYSYFRTRVILTNLNILLLIIIIIKLLLLLLKELKLLMLVLEVFFKLIELFEWSCDLCKFRTHTHFRVDYWLICSIWEHSIFILS